MDIRFLSINGQRIALRTAGHGPVVLLLHGMAGSSATWRRVVPALATRFTVLAPDLLGHGESAKPRGEYSLGNHANVLRDLLNELGIRRATLVGQSLGGGIAMQLAYQFPDRAERLVLVGSGGLGREVHVLLRALATPGSEYAFAPLCRPTVHAAVRRVAGWWARDRWHVDPAAEEMWRSYASLADGAARRAFFRTLRAVVDTSGQSISAMDRLHFAATMPTLIVWGTRDPFIPIRHGITAHEAIPGSRLEVFDEVGHFPHCESPERFAEVLVDFISSTEPAPIADPIGRLVARG